MLVLKPDVHQCVHNSPTFHPIPSWSNQLVATHKPIFNAIALYTSSYVPVLLELKCPMLDLFVLPMSWPGRRYKGEALGFLRDEVYPD